MDLKEIPHIDEKLVKYLEEKFPNRLPSVPFTEQEVAIKKGNSQVVEHLREAYSAQNRDADASTTIQGFQ